MFWKIPAQATIFLSRVTKSKTKNCTPQGILIQVISIIFVLFEERSLLKVLLPIVVWLFTKLCWSLLSNFIENTFWLDNFKKFSKIILLCTLENVINLSASTARAVLPSVCSQRTRVGELCDGSRRIRGMSYICQGPVRVFCIIGAECRFWPRDPSRRKHFVCLVHNAKLPRRKCLFASGGGPFQLWFCVVCRHTL